MPATQEELTARIKELRRQIADHYQQISTLERELARTEEQRLQQAPRGTYRHQREGGGEITVTAAVLETDGQALYIQYTIPRGQAHRGEEDGYLRWLRTPEDLARFTPGTKSLAI
jgi:hypothetical protein